MFDFLSSFIEGSFQFFGYDIFAVIFASFLIFWALFFIKYSLWGFK